MTQRHYFPRSIAIANGKGGVGKTSTTANVGGLAAANGWRVLLIDLDPQGNLCRDLGYDKSDGSGLLHALIAGQVPPVLTDVRPNLDVVAGGPMVGDIAGLMFSRMSRNRGGVETLGDLLFKSLAPIASNYDLILVDTPPGEQMIIDGILECVQAVVIPARPDEASLDGLELVAQRFAGARSRNPDLMLAGVVLFGVGSRSSKLEALVRNSVSEIIGAAAPIFATRIRYLETAGFDLRRHGILAHELEGRAQNAKIDRIAALRAGTAVSDKFLARNIAGLADDYEALTTEIITRLNEIEKQEELT